MQFNRTAADLHALKLVELLIQQGHYSAHRTGAIEQIVKDAKELSAAFTDPSVKRS